MKSNSLNWSDKPFRFESILLTISKYKYTPNKNIKDMTIFTSCEYFFSFLDTGFAMYIW